MRADAGAGRLWVRVAIVAVALAATGLVGVTGVEQEGPSQARAQGEPEPPGPFPDVYPTGDTYTVPGERDGRSEFPVVRYRQLQPKQPGVMDFQHYHSEAEMNWWMRKWAFEHQDIVALDQVGTSFGGKPIYQLTITNKDTGPATDKPAAYFDGGRHSGEITATEAAFYHAWKLVSEYGRDPAITRLVDEKAIYIRPNSNPDGGDVYRHTAQTNRSSVRPVDNDGNGLLDDDPPTDLNGDGYITQMRKEVGAGNGNFVVDDRDPTGRTMRRVPQGEGNYQVFPESRGAGSDGVGGLDLHRNYPGNWRPMPGEDATGRGWTQVGAGEYPLSEPEIRSTFLFLVKNPNVGAVNSMDTPADMILRGPSTCNDEECMYKEDIKLLEHFDEVGQKLTGYTRAGNVYFDYATQSPRLAEGSTPDDPQPNPLFGHGPDFGYFQFGAVWYGDELWISGGRIKDYDGDGRYGDWEGQRWCVEKGVPDCFLEWRPYDHPELGGVEIGGMNPKFFSQNGPAEVLEDVVKGQVAYNMYLAESLPQVGISSTRVSRTSGSDGATHEVQVTVENTGRIPTALEQAKEVKIVRPDTVRVVLPPGTGEVVGPAPTFFLGAGESERVTVRIKVDGANPPQSLTVRALSTRGGVDEKTVAVAGG